MTQASNPSDATAIKAAPEPKKAPPKNNVLSLLNNTKIRLAVVGFVALILLFLLVLSSFGGSKPTGVDEHGEELTIDTPSTDAQGDPSMTPEQLEQWRQKQRIDAQKALAAGQGFQPAVEPKLRESVQAQTTVVANPMIQPGTAVVGTNSTSGIAVPQAYLPPPSTTYNANSNNYSANSNAGNNGDASNNSQWSEGGNGGNGADNSNGDNNNDGNTENNQQYNVQQRMLPPEAERLAAQANQLNQQTTADLALREQGLKTRIEQGRTRVADRKAQVDDAFNKQISRIAGVISDSKFTGYSVTTVSRPAAQKTATADQGATNPSAANTQTSTTPDGEVTGTRYRVGTTWIAANTKTVNSDNGTDIVAKLINGPLAGSTLMGTISPTGNDVKITFTALVPSDTSKNTLGVSISASPVGSKPLATVKNHTIQRYSAMIASSALQGYGEAYSADIGTTVTQGNAVVQTVPEPSDKQIQAKVLGQVGTTMSGDIAKYSGRPPTYIIPAGRVMNVLITQELIVP